MKLPRKLAVAAAGLMATFSTAAIADGPAYSYSYYECSFGTCTLITCNVYYNDDGPRGTTQVVEICSPAIGGGGGPGGF